MKNTMNPKPRLTLVDKIALILVMGGSINYLLAVFNIDLMRRASIGMDVVSKLIYLLITLSGLWVTYVLLRDWR